MAERIEFASFDKAVQKKLALPEVEILDELELLGSEVSQDLAELAFRSQPMPNVDLDDIESSVSTREAPPSHLIFEDCRAGDDVSTVALSMIARNQLNQRSASSPSVNQIRPIAPVIADRPLLVAKRINPNVNSGSIASGGTNGLPLNSQQTIELFPKPRVPSDAHRLTTLVNDGSSSIVRVLNAGLLISIRKNNF